MIYHVSGLQEWKLAQEAGEYVHPSLAAEGFIHLCEEDQLKGVLQRYYKGVSDIVLLVVDESKLINPLKYEHSPSVNECFPHCFGFINLDAVVAVRSFADFFSADKKIERVIINSPVGKLEIVCENEIVRSILFVGEDVAVPADRGIVVESPVLQSCVNELDAYFKGSLHSFSFPFAQAGTEFRQRVWKELEKVPYGRTLTYLEISKRLGDVKAIRAAASANGKNQLSIVVPCHRIIGSDGSLTGYAGGLDKKKWLLDHESKHGSATHQLAIF